jgi:murein DD-endopeptidase MepM/ murein hydrolase activator NlpD
MTAPTVFEVYLNGRRLGNDQSGGDLVGAGSPYPTGTLRLGSTADGKTQFYGLLDDLAVFDKALSQAEINQLAASASLTGSEDGLLAGIPFDLGLEYGPELQHAPTYEDLIAGKSAARYVVVSGTHSSADAQHLLWPVQQKALHLPFAGGQPWKVLQPFNNPSSSHNDYAAFCWDFVRSDVADPLADTCGSPLYAAGKGEVVDAFDEGGGANLDAPNVLDIEMAPDEIAGYMHLRTGSITSVLGASPKGKTVSRGQHIGSAGTRKQHNCHLHFGVKNILGDGALTFPVAFSDYEVWDSGSDKWKPVHLGMPRPGEVFRRPEPAGCAQLRQQINLLQDEKQSLADGFDEKGAPQKSATAKQIYDAQEQIDALEAKATAMGCKP